MADGYDLDFLPTPIPLPRPAQSVRELTYPRFTVLLDPARRLAAVTGVTIDGGALREVSRTGEWRLDPRVDDELQTGPAVYARNDLDRGHLVRRRDPGWGDAAEARAATEATFFYPNAAPQAAGFNQSKELWLGLEDHVIAYAESTDQRVSVFTAPVLADDDPPYRGIRIPLRFWKVAAWEGPDGLAAAGFLLDQSDLVDLSEGLRAAPPLGGFRTFQVPITEIEAIASIDLGALADADVLPLRTVRPASRIELESVDDIVL
jgi:endonuclease G, mitochondrial